MSLSSPSYEEHAETIQERNKQIVRRMYEETVNQHDLDAIERFYAEGFVNHDAAPGSREGVDGVRDRQLQALLSFPDFHVDVVDLIAEGDRVVARIHGEGTHEGTFLGVPPTGRRWSAQGIDVFRVEDGRLVERWGVVDALSILEQLQADVLPQRNGPDPDI